MATLKPVAKQVMKVVAKQVMKVAAKTAIKREENYEVYDMSGIELQTKGGGGGGRGLSPFSEKAFSLEHGQGFKISEQRYGVAGKGMASTYAGAARRGIKLRIRRDKDNQLWLFRVSETIEQEAAERTAQRLADRQEALAQG